MADPFSGIKDKDLANFCRDLVKRGYEVRHMGTDHFQAFWDGEYTKCRIPLTPRSGSAFTRAKADIKRFERSHGMYVEPVKSERPKKPKVKAPRLGKFIMPSADDVSDRRPASIAPTQYTVATMLGPEAMMKLASAVMPGRLKEVTMTQENTKPRRTWTDEEKAAIVQRYREAVKDQKGESLLRELGIYNSHITSFSAQLKRNGWDLDATSVEPQVTLGPVIDDEGNDSPASIEAIGGQVVVAEPVFDPDEEITELTAQWSGLVSRKRELAEAFTNLNARIDDLLNKAEELTIQRDKVTAGSADVAAKITKVRKRLAEVAGSG